MAPTLGRIVLAGLLAFAVPGIAQAEPTNQELFEMLKAQQAEINELKQQQGILKQEADDAREAANVAEQKLKRTEAELAAVRADVSALPDVAADGDEVAAEPGIFASFDVLFWDFDGGKEFDYAGVGRTDPFPAANGFSGDVETADWDDDEGFRGEAGYRFGSGIDVALRGTTFDTDGGDSVQNRGQTLQIFALANLFHDDSLEAVRHASADMELDFYQIDLEAGKWFSIGDGVDLRPFGLIRYSDFEYDLDLRYCINATCNGRTGPGGLRRDLISTSTDWWGAGILGGVEGQWSFLDRFSLFGRGAAGILGGEYDVSGDYRSPTRQAVTGAKEDGDTFVPVLEASVGLGIHLFEMAGMAFDIEAGYEALSFIDSPTLWQGDGGGLNTNSPDSRSIARMDEETVTFHGGFLRLGVGF